MHRKILRPLAITAAVAVSVAMAGCSSGTSATGSSDSGSSAKKEVHTLTIGYQVPVAAYLPGLLAGLNVSEFTKRGIHFKASQISAPDSLPLLATGKLDAYIGPVSAAVFNAIGSGANVAIVAPGPYSTDPAPWSISKAALKGKKYSLESWRGQKVYNSTGSGSYVMISLEHELAKAGMTPDDVQFSQMPPDDVVPALKSGALFAGIINTKPQRESLLKSGDIINGPSAVWPDKISPGFVFFGSSLLGNPELAQKVEDGFAELETERLQGDYLKDKDTAAYIEKALDIKPDQLQGFASGYGYQPDMSFPDGWVQNAEKVWRSLGVLTYKGSVADKVVDTKLIDKALDDVKRK